MKLPKELTKITPLSKALALLLFFLLPVVGFLFGMRYQTMLIEQQKQFPVEVGLSSFRKPVSDNNKKQPFVCPKSTYVNCMPTVGAKQKIECTTDYLQWAKKNCSNFKGAAY